MATEPNQRSNARKLCFVSLTGVIMLGAYYAGLLLGYASCPTVGVCSNLDTAAVFFTVISAGFAITAATLSLNWLAKVRRSTSIEAAIVSFATLYSSIVALDAMWRGNVPWYAVLLYAVIAVVSVIVATYILERLGRLSHIVTISFVVIYSICTPLILQDAIMETKKNYKNLLTIEKIRRLDFATYTPSFMPAGLKLDNLIVTTDRDNPEYRLDYGSGDKRLTITGSKDTDPTLNCGIHQSAECETVGESANCTVYRHATTTNDSIMNAYCTKNETQLVLTVGRTNLADAEILAIFDSLQPGLPQL